MKPFHAIVIGAGSTGAAITHDLALRGFRVTLVERFGIAGGTTGHNQAQLHSGARYAVKDPLSACECMQENLILRRILPDAMELNDGLFIALSEEHLTYRPIFLEACANCAIPTREIAVKEALRLEPLLNPEILAAIQIPDGVFDPYRFTLSFVATARKNGAVIMPFSTVVDIDVQRGIVKVLRRTTGETAALGCDVLVNAAGPWAPQVAAFADVKIDVEPSAGVMVTVKRRLCNMVINLLAPPGDADIIVPQRQTSILGTTSWTVENPDNIPIPPEHVESLFSQAEWMIPGTRRAPLHGVMAAARPLIKSDIAGGRNTTRGYACYDHASAGAKGFFSIIGGKTTTARLMAEKMVDMICTRLGVQVECRTQSEPLLSYRLGL